VTLAPLPLLRRGAWYQSADQLAAPGPALPPVSLAPEILLRRDARRLRTAALPAVPGPPARAAILADAVRLFTADTVDCGGLGKQTAADFRTALWRSAGLPAALVDRWCAMLTGGLAVTTSKAQTGTVPAGMAPAGPAAGPRPPRLTLISLPANTFTCLESVLSALWAGDVAWVRPSSREPLSALRLVSALVQAGWPAELIGFYPTVQGLLRTLAGITDRQIVYGGPGLAAVIGRSPGAEVHGPMRVCAVIPDGAGPDQTAAALLPLLARDGGRFCTTVRAIFCRADPAQLAERLAARLDAIPFPPHVSPGLPLAASQDAGQAAAVAAAVTSRLGAGDAIVTARPLLSSLGTGACLAPTLVRLASPGQDGQPDWGQPPLLGFEAPFPLATIMQVTGAQEARLTAAADLTHRLAGHRVPAGRTGGGR